MVEARGYEAAVGRIGKTISGASKLTLWRFHGHRGDPVLIDDTWERVTINDDMIGATKRFGRVQSVNP